MRCAKPGSDPCTGRARILAEHRQLFGTVRFDRQHVGEVGHRPLPHPQSRAGLARSGDRADHVGRLLRHLGDVVVGEESVGAAEVVAGHDSNVGTAQRIGEASQPPRPAPARLVRGDHRQVLEQHGRDRD